MVKDMVRVNIRSGLESELVKDVALNANRRLSDSSSAVRVNDRVMDR